MNKHITKILYSLSTLWWFVCIAMMTHVARFEHPEYDMIARIFTGVIFGSLVFAITCVAAALIIGVYMENHDDD